MISEKLAKAINDQINKEIYSSYLYYAMAAQAEAQGFKGCANWFHIQALEELTHADKFFKYLCSQGALPVMEAVDKPELKGTEIKALFEQTLEHERFVTSRINSLMKLTREEGDYASEIFLQWYVNEQIEEEENATGILDQIRLTGDSKQGMFMLDRELAARVFTPPPAPAAD